jgi:hypothetical protein
MTSMTSLADSIIEAHGPLTSQEIRLLEVYPSASDSDGIKCRRFRVSLDAIDMYSYEALSYVWGDATNRTDIVCDGLLFSVTISLAEALRKLRLPHRSRLIWVDAICIDQCNLLEKNSQIPIMGKIYSIADRVVVWLGEVDAAQSEGVEEIVQLLAKHIKKSLREGGFDETSLHGYDTLRIPDDCTSVTAREVLKRLYAMTWFSRIWCIQEIVLAKKAVMLWGEHELSWQDVGMIATLLNELTPQRALGYDENAFYADIEVQQAHEMYAIQQTEWHDFISLLDGCSFSFQATNPRDRVYGLLALVEENEEAQALCVDYDKSFGEVYADAVVAAIQTNEDLTPLKYVYHGMDYQLSDDNLPSWTPRWHDKDGLRPMPAESSPLSACKMMSVTSVDASKINSRRLCLEGLFYSEVTDIHTAMDLNSLENLRKHPFREDVLAVLNHETDTKRYGSIMDMLARTLTAGCDSVSKDLDTATEEDQFIFYASFQMIMLHLWAGIDDMNIRTQFPFKESFYDEAEIVCTNRRLVRTMNGNFGLGPITTRKGDIIVVLFGGHTPYVLRPYGDFYLFIGQVYIDNLMKGELVDEMNAGRAHKREFCLV